MAQRKGKEKSPSKPRGGRQQGVTNFGGPETQELVRVVAKWLPIGLNGWTAAQEEYNQFAKKNNLRERDCRSLRQKFDKVSEEQACGNPTSRFSQLVSTAQTKPTGEANRSELLTMVLQINDKLDAKSGTGILDDELSDDAGGHGGEADVFEAKHKVIHLTSDGESAVEEPVKAPKPVKSTFVVKGYRTANPLETKTRTTRASTSQAMEAISAISAHFSADRVREREDTRATNSIHMMQLQSAQNDLREVRLELREVRAENKQLSESLRTETFRADKLDLRVIHLEDKIEILKARNDELKSDLQSMRQHRHHRHNTKSDFDSDSESSPHKRTHRQKRRRQLTPPSPSQKAAAIPPDNLNTRASPHINSTKTGEEA